MSKVTPALGPVVIGVFSACYCMEAAKDRQGTQSLPRTLRQDAAVIKPNGRAPLGQSHGPRTYGNDALSTILI
jgi:hypothetical protein